MMEMISMAHLSGSFDTQSGLNVCEVSFFLFCRLPLAQIISKLRLDQFYHLITEINLRLELYKT